MCLAHGALESDGPMRVAATLEMQSSESQGFITDSTNGPMDAKGYGGFDRSCLITMIECG